MYKELKAQIVRQGSNVEKLAEAIGVSRAQLYAKLKGNNEFTLSECAKIERALNYTEGFKKLFDLPEASDITDKGA